MDSSLRGDDGQRGTPVTDRALFSSADASFAVRCIPSFAGVGQEDG